VTATALAEGPGLVRVLVVDDSRTDSELICRMLRTNPEVKVAASADTGKDALLLAGRIRPDVMILDLQLPDMGGLDVIEELMAFSPLPILVLSATGGDKKIALEALARGAVEVMEKPDLDSLAAFNHHAGHLTRLVKIVARSRVITHPRGRLARQGISPPTSAAPPPKIKPKVRPSAHHPARVASPPPPAVLSRSDEEPPIMAVGIAASTGGPQALRTILAELPTSFPIPVLIVQHIAQGFTQGLVDWLGAATSMPVHVAHDGALALPGHVYLAAEGMHLEMRRHRLALRPGDPVSGHCPSADVMLASLAVDLKNRCLAVVLTGMGRDGAIGARAIFESGGEVIVQDESTSAVFGMPKAAVDLGAVTEILPLPEISQAIARRVEKESAAPGGRR
jgi:two-component system, chemotaxis family, protein-glutamate methylesterase/glutaminase